MPPAARRGWSAARCATGCWALPVQDIDLATRLPPAEVIRRLEAAGLKAVPTGLAHGTVTAVAQGLTAEVTTLRRDVATFGRHAEVAFTDDWQEDASRRDFTINALYATLPAGEISDFFGGLDDLTARRVRFIGDAADSALPRIICGSCAFSAFRRALPTRSMPKGWRPAPPAPMT